MSKSATASRLAHHDKTPRPVEQLARIAAASAFLGGALLTGICAPIEVSARQQDSHISFVKTETVSDKQFENEQAKDPQVIVATGTATTAGEDVEALQKKADRAHRVAGKTGWGSGILLGLGVIVGTVAESIGLRRRRASSAQMQENLANQALIHAKIRQPAVGRAAAPKPLKPLMKRVKDFEQEAKQTISVSNTTTQHLDQPERTLGAAVRQDLEALMESRKARQEKTSKEALLSLYSPALAECSREIADLRAEFAEISTTIESIREDMAMPAYNHNVVTSSVQPTANPALHLPTSHQMINEPSYRPAALVPA